MMMLSASTPDPKPPEYAADSKPLDDDDSTRG